MLESIKELNPMSVPINFFIPNDKLPLTQIKITKEEALFWISEYRKNLSKSMIMIAGGRELIFGKTADDFVSGMKAAYPGYTGEFPLNLAKSNWNK
jgi:biotin synthase